MEMALAGCVGAANSAFDATCFLLVRSIKEHRKLNLDERDWTWPTLRKWDENGTWPLRCAAKVRDALAEDDLKNPVGSQS